MFIRSIRGCFAAAPTGRSRRNPSIRPQPEAPAQPEAPTRLEAPSQSLLFITLIRSIHTLMQFRWRGQVRALTVGVDVRDGGTALPV